MRWFGKILGLVACSAAIFCSYPLCATEPTGQGVTRSEGKMTVDDKPRRYILRVPLRLDTAHPVPLVMLLHGYSDDAAFAERAYGFAKLAAEKNFIVVYPEGTGEEKQKGWYGLDFSTPNFDLDFLKALLAQLRKDYPIDPRRIYVAGHSSGAIMAYRFAGECSDQVAAAGIVAGVVGRYDDNAELVIMRRPQFPVSIIAFHGKADPNIPFENPTHDADTSMSVPDSIRFWRAADLCDVMPVHAASHGGNILRDDWGNGKGGTAVTLVTVVNGNHMWPGSDVGPEKPMPNKDIDATELMWAFFAAHPKQFATGPSAAR